MAEPSRVKWFSPLQPKFCWGCHRKVTLPASKNWIGAFFQEFPVFRTWCYDCRRSRK